MADITTFQAGANEPDVCTPPFWDLLGISCGIENATRGLGNALSSVGEGASSAAESLGENVSKGIKVSLILLAIILGLGVVALGFWVLR
jgi:hypothetical protein